MISSEVQRTLVKSPPELWAELSDPDSLSRHLGELGEIKITRVEPEKLVEWEAAGITGKVAIKASGWGTRVTLTVEREVAEPAAEIDAVEETEEPDEGEAAAEAEIAAAEEPDDGIAGEAEIEHDGVVTEAEPDAIEPESAIEQEPEAPIQAAPTVEQEPAETLVADGREERAGSDELRPAPATEAARRAAGLLPPEPAEEAPTERAAEPSAPEPRRRGFFARLFGARRKRPDVETDVPSATAEPSATTIAAPLAEELPEAGASLEHVPSPAAEEIPEAPETETALSDAETTAEIEAQPGAETAVDAEAGHDEVAPEADTGSQSAKEIAAELAAAEECATADVTAILTGVLDRLGAAHHRPFSRA